MEKITEQILAKVVVKRPIKSHKGNYGLVLLIGGSANFGGAILMAAEGAINAGAGLVSVATHSINNAALHARLPEAMFIDWRDRGLADLLKKMDVVVIGPGLGTGTTAVQLLQLVAQTAGPAQKVVLDASALDLIAKQPNLLPKRAGLVVLTPHQMEWQRVSGIQIAFQDDAANQTALQQLLGNQKGILVLKSEHTHVYFDDQIFINTTGNPAMATGGMGDTLAGIIAGFLGQFPGNLEPVLAAVYAHSLAGDLLAQDRYVVLPTQISEFLPHLLKKFADKSAKM